MFNRRHQIQNSNLRLERDSHLGTCLHRPLETAITRGREPRDFFTARAVNSNREWLFSSCATESSKVWRRKSAITLSIVFFLTAPKIVCRFRGTSAILKFTLRDGSRQLGVRRDRLRDITCKDELNEAAPESAAHRLLLAHHVTTILPNQERTSAML